jgi:hypothetical protein
VITVLRELLENRGHLVDSVRGGFGSLVTPVNVGRNLMLAHMT